MRAQDVKEGFPRRVFSESCWQAIFCKIAHERIPLRRRAVRKRARKACIGHAFDVFEAGSIDELTMAFRAAQGAVYIMHDVGSDCAGVEPPPTSERPLMQNVAQNVAQGGAQGISHGTVQRVARIR